MGRDPNVVPAGMEQPRKNSVAGSIRPPARCNRRTRKTP